MLIYLIAAFVGIPLLELFLLLKISNVLGAFETILVVVVTGILGAWLARKQGLQTATGVRSELAAGRMPAGRMLDGVLILVAAAVLMTPGVITDAVGFALLLPPVRTVVRNWAGRRLEAYVRTGRW